MRCNRADVRNGFTLIEVLIGLTITGFIGIILIDFTRWIVISSRRSAALLLARDRGERVIAFIEPRILHCALGLSECSTKNLFQKALGKGTGKELSQLTDWSYLPIAVYINERGNLADKSSDGVFRGKSFAVVYSRPSGLAVRTLDKSKKFLSSGESILYKIFKGEISKTRFQGSSNYNDLRSWCVLPSAGVPFHIDTIFIDNNRLKLTLADSWHDNVEIPPICEVYTLAADRFYVAEIDSEFRFQEMQILFYPASGYPRENGVLAMYVEWRPEKKIFDLYVLTSGGDAVYGKSSRPAAWPAEADWKRDFEDHELYVSRASWRIKNL